MYNRYHKKVHFPDADKDSLIKFTNKLNNLNWCYTRHCLDNLNYRVIDIEGMLKFIKNITLDYNQIFEYYKGAYIEKACYRVTYGINDIILVISEHKSIITIYLNAKDDSHDTLKEHLYCRS